MINGLNGTGKFSVLIAAAIAVVMSMQGMKAYRTLSEKAAAQDAVTESVHRWQQSFQALSSTVQRWETQYRREDTVQDLVSLQSIVDLGSVGLRSDTDKVFLSKVEPVIENGIHLGLTRICLASSGSGGGGLEVRTDNYSALFDGINRLAARPDIYIGTITVVGEKATPAARLGDFCIMLRKG